MTYLPSQANVYMDLTQKEKGTLNGRGRWGALKAASRSRSATRSEARRCAKATVKIQAMFRARGPRRDMMAKRKIAQSVQTVRQPPPPPARRSHSLSPLALARGVCLEAARRSRRTRAGAPLCQPQLYKCHVSSLSRQAIRARWLARARTFAQFHGQDGTAGKRYYSQWP